MKFIITESQERRILNLIEQSIKKIDLSKEKVSQYCKPQIVPKSIIETNISEINKKIDDKINREKDTFIKENPEIKEYGFVINLFEDIQEKMTPKIKEMLGKKLYAEYGYGTYDDKISKQELISIIFNMIISKIKRIDINLMLKALVTKKNVDDVKKSLGLIFWGINNLLKWCVDVVYNMSRIEVLTSYFKIAPLCKNVIVVVDSSYNKLPPNKQYHPKYDAYTVDLSYTDFKSLIKSYKEQVSKIIDSYV